MMCSRARSLLTVAVLFFLFSALSHASLKNETLPYDWTGFYAGLNVGFVKHTMNITDIQATTFYATIQEVLNPSFTGGVQAGYRRHLCLNKESGVYGLEFSANFLNAKFSQDYGSPFALYQLRSENELKNIYLLQAIGGLSADNSLLFLAAGLSWVNIAGSTINLDSIPFFQGFNVDKQVFGTVVGGGVEYAFSKAFSARFKVDFIMPNAYVVFDDLGNDFQISNAMVQGLVGCNYKFG